MSSANPLLSTDAPQARREGCVPAAGWVRLGVWRGGDWQSANDEQAPRTLASGHAPLDAQLPGGGWPVGGMSEILMPGFLHPEWTLVAGALARVLQEQPQRRAVLVAPPLEVFTPFAKFGGVDAGQLCCVHPVPSRASGRLAGDASSVWAGEQALRCRDVCAVLAWLPQAQPAALRRLQLLAAQQRQLLWVFRPEQARGQSSPAPLRLWLRAADKTLQVHVLKRRGPPLVQPVALPWLHPRLEEELHAQARRKAQAREDAAALLRSLRPRRVDHREVLSHALAGMAFAARR